MKNRLVWLGEIILLGLAACSAATPAAPGNAPPPTVSEAFASGRATQTLGGTPDPKAPPTLSALFHGAPLTATVSSDAKATGAPTVAPIFHSEALPAPTSARDPGHTPTIAAVMRPSTPGVGLPNPTRTPAQARETPAPKSAARANLTELIIFDEQVHANWSLETSQNMQVNAANTTRAQAGKTAIAATPQQDFATLYFTVRRDAKDNYPRSRVWGVSVWLNGDGVIGPEDLALTIVGSNQNPYWVAEDKSVTLDDKHFFSETRLYYLGVTREIPANTWVELTVQTDKLPYDPEYQYVTGIYFKTEKGFRKTFYVDRVTLWLNK